MSKKKPVESFSANSELVLAIWQIIGYDPANGKSKSECYLSYFQNLILDKNSQPISNPANTLDHLNIDDPNGIIQTYLRRHDAETERTKNRIAEAYLIQQAKERAKTEGEKDRVEIREEERLAKHAGVNTSSKPKVDWGQSEGVDGFELGET